MNHWIIQQEVNLQNGSPQARHWPHALMVQGDNQAHTWRVKLFDGNAPASLSGASIRGYFARADGVTVPVEGTLSGNVAEVTLVSSCYAVDGDLRGIMRASTVGQTITLSVLVLQVRREITDAFADPERLIPSIDELLEQIERMESGTNAANEAAKSANTAATKANTAASNADAATGKANTAADRLSEVELFVEMLPPSADPTANVKQTAKKTTFELGIPASNLAYATFEVNDDMQLMMNSPDGFDDISFVLNNGDLEVHV